MYVSICTAGFDAVFGQRLRLSENVSSFSGISREIQEPEDLPDKHIDTVPPE